MKTIHALIATTALAGVLGGAGHAAAQAAAPQVTEVVVTAQKREQKLQDIPVSASAFNAKMLEQQTVTNVTDLDGKIPNVQFDKVATFPNSSSFAIRGLAFGDVESTFEPTVGVEFNGVLLARNVGATVDVFDLNSVEVLRGPQGTLEGANTIGGLVSMTTKKPTGGLDGQYEFTIGDHKRVEFRLATDFPIIKDVLAARVVFQDLNYGGYLHNIYNGARMGQINSISERLTLAYTPSSNFDATLVVDHSQDHDGGFPNINGTPPAGAIAPAPDFVFATYFASPENPNQKPYDVDSSTPQHYDFTTYGGSLTMNYRLPFGTITSVTGYREYDDYNTQEYGGAGYPFFTSDRTQNHDQISQEVRLASRGSNFIDYVAGVSYLHTHYDLQNTEGGCGLFFRPDLCAPGVLVGTTTQYANQNDDAVGVFGQADVHINQQLTLTVGGRYSYEAKDFHNRPTFLTTTFNNSDNWSDFSPKAALSYKVTPDVMGYVQYSRGYRSGGFNGRAGSASSAGPYNSENVDNYEVGVKSEWFHRRLVVNGDLFMMKYNRIQEEVQRPNPDTGADETVVFNAGSATYQGAEVEAHAALDYGLSLDAAAGYLDAHFNKFVANLNGDCSSLYLPSNNYFCGTRDYKGLDIPDAPKWTVSAAGTWRHEFSRAVFTANVNAVYNSSQFTSLTPINSFVPWFSLRKANTIVNSTVSLATPDEKYKVSVWVKNLTDEHVLYQRFSVTYASPESYKPPLTWGVSLAGKF